MNVVKTMQERMQIMKKTTVDFVLLFSLSDYVPGDVR